MTNTILSQSDVSMLVTHLVGAGTRVIAPVPVGEAFEEVEYRPIQRIEEASLGGPQPRRSLKEFFRPSPEARPPYAPQVILGARPCDAAGVENLDNVMGWNYRDEQWLARRKATTIVSLACPGAEETCFCSAVGLGPNSTKGCDVLLVPLELASKQPPAQRRIADRLRRAVDTFLHDVEPFPGAADAQAGADSARPPPQPALRYLAQAVTPKGQALLAGWGERLADDGDVEKAAGFARTAQQAMEKNLVVLHLPVGRGRLDAGAEARLGLAAADGGELLPSARAMLPPDPSADLRALPEWLARNFDHEAWKPISARCRSCGTCQAVCSTSPCFDLVDEHRRAREEARGPFPPRPKPAASGPGAPPIRADYLRQRVMHKFSIYPRRFNSILCTGCGRCSRNCEGGVKLPEVLGQLVRLAGPEPQGAVR